jgi:predicted dinucleotide-binding enzyme
VRITTIGRGNVGGGLGELWRKAGHEVVEVGRAGGDASGSDAVLLAVPQTAIADALASVSGLAGVPVIDAINAVRGPRPEGFESLAEYVRSLTGGPVAKAFNANFATLYDRIGAWSTPPTTERAT